MFEDKSVCVIIPAYNEERSIGSVLSSIPSYVDRIIVIDDGSIDQTAKIAKEAGAVVVSHAGNKGLGIAFKTGIQEALRTQSDIIVNIDADGQFNPSDIDKIIKPIVDGNAGFVTASRFVNPGFYPEMPKIKFYGNLLMSKIISNIIGRKFHDVSCGFRAYSRDTACRLNLFGKYTYTQEAFIDLAFKDTIMVEVPVVVRGVREYGQSKVASNLFRYGYNCIKIILRIFRDYRALRVFGILSLITFLIGLGFATFFIGYFLTYGAFDRHKWSAFVAAFFIFLALSLFIIGFVADMISRIRYTLEEILAHMKKQSS